MRLPVHPLSTSVLLLSVAGVSSAEEFHAAGYHDANCMRCHDNSVYTRDNRRVQSYPMLQAQVARCDANLGTQLFPEDLSQLVDHLNDSFYKFAR